jgi:hypothetical protein
MSAMRWVASTSLLAGVLSLMGCAVVDQYSGRAIAYNLEAEQAEDQPILLNVIRASLRRPMQFTTVSTITGTASAGGGVGYTAPINVPFRPVTNGSSIAGFPPLNTWTFNATMSGGPTFTVPVLDTQEFYQGILKPIPGQLYDLYSQANYPHDVLFNLFVQRVVMIKEGCDDHLPACEYDFHNNPGNEIELKMFQALGDYLSDLRFSTEATPTAQNIPFNKPVNINLRLVGASPLGSSSASTSGSSAGSTESSQSGGGESKKYGFCFSPRTKESKNYVPPEYVCTIPIQQKSGHHARRGSAEKETMAKEAASIKTTGEATGVVTASKYFVERLEGIVPPDQRKYFAGFEDQKVSLSFYLRSVEGIFYYLGEVARREMAPENGESPRTVLINTGASTREPCTLDTPQCWPIFVVRTDTVPAPGDFLSTFYDGRRFAVPSMDDGGGYSSAVLDIVKQLLALNSSAKSLPQSSVVSVIGQ